MSKRQIVPIPPITLLTDGLITLLLFCFYGPGKEAVRQSRCPTHTTTLILWWDNTTEALEALLGKVRPENRVTYFYHLLFQLKNFIVTPMIWNSERTNKMYGVIPHISKTQQKVNSNKLGLQHMKVHC